MAPISILVTILFIAVTFSTVWLFYKASGRSKVILFGLCAWMLLQTVISLIGFYQWNQSTPPRFIFLIAPGAVLTVILFFTKNGKAFIDSLNIKDLTLLHSIRVFVEITLYFMFLSSLIPRLMTFEGYNYDILSGLTAPLIYYFGFVVKRVGRRFLLVWNFVCLALLVNILTIAILSVQTPFQKLAFDQPNIGLAYFPFVWLPAVVVPLVLFSHLASIRQLLIPVRPYEA
jgi:hypothetical protein